MFRKSGRRRSYQSNDSSTSSSSSEEESLYDSPPSPPSAFPEPAVRFDESSKVSQVRYALIHAYQCVATILEPETDEKSVGWVALGRALAILGKHGGDGRVRAALEMDTLLNPLLVIVKHQIIPLADSKQYLRSISKDDFKATYSVLNHWSFLSSLLDHVDEDRMSTILSTSKRILYRFLIYTLEPKRALELSELNFGLRLDIDHLDLSIYLDLLNIPESSVIAVKFNKNKLEHIPLHFLSAFPCLKYLDVSNNQITRFPFHIMRLPLHSIRWKGRRPDIPKTTPRIQRRPWHGTHSCRPRRPLQSLVQLCVVSLHRSFVDLDLDVMDISPHITNLVTGSYSCELCDNMCLVGGRDKIKEVRLAYSYKDAGHIPVGGRLCLTCLVFLSTVDEVSGKLLAPLR